MHHGLAALLLSISGCSLMPSQPAVPEKVDPSHTESVIATSTQSASPQPLPTATTAILPVETLINEVANEPLDPWANWHAQRQILSFPKDRVESHIDGFRRQTQLFRQLDSRSTLYLPYILQELTARNMPSEILALPIIESNLDPFAYSQGRAAGLWQFIPSTGRHFGLESDWWYDGRRDIVAATQVALDYLQQHHQLFNDWPLAIAAYNGGAGTIMRAQQRNRDQGLADDYWSLTLPRETREYVGKILAMSELLSHAERFDLQRPNLPDSPVFAEVDTQGQLDLTLIANHLNVELDDLYRLNPGLNRWSTPPQGPHRLLVPKQQQAATQDYIASLPNEERMAWQRHQVVAGDTLGGIAQQYQTSSSIIRSTNNIDGTLIRIGQILLIPGTTPLHQPQVNAQDQQRVHRVLAGESLWTIARQHQVTVAQLTQWNNLTAGSVLRVGQELRIHNQDSSQIAPRDVITRTVYYRVRSGDTLASIGNRFSVSSQQILQRNNINANVRAGQQLVIEVPINPY